MSQQLVVSNNSGQKLKENVKRDKRKLVKHLKKKQSKNEKTTHTKQEHTHVKNLKRQLMAKDFWSEGNDILIIPLPFYFPSHFRLLFLFLALAA